MRAIRTDQLSGPLPSATEALWVYNGLDTCVTYEVLEAILPELDNSAAATYQRSLALQAPVLDMKLRGILVDTERRKEVIDKLEASLTCVEADLNRILSEGIGHACNWRSPQQLARLFYEVMGIPPVSRRGKITVDRSALERIQAYFYAGPVVSRILALRDYAKKLGVLYTAIDSDGRMRTSYNIAGTDTGRFSSNLSDFGSGTNLQNVADVLRSVFISDPSLKLAYIDLEQAESRLVGAIEWRLFHDGRYLDACESGDLHTSVAQLAWPALPWTEDLIQNKALAEAPFYRHMSYRDTAKRLGHGTNYDGTPSTMSLHTKIPTAVVRTFQSGYFAAFPAHREWHTWVKRELARTGQLTTMLGRRRHFFGRRDDPATQRQAIAYEPQSTVAELLNLGMLKVWRADICQLLLQIHDAIVTQYHEEQEDEIIPQLLELIRVPLDIGHGRTLVIPSDVKVGWNWGLVNERNPDGLAKWKGYDSRRRIRSPATSFVDRLFS